MIIPYACFLDRKIGPMSNRDDENIDIERKMDTKNTVFFIPKYIAYPMLYQNILGYFFGTVQS